MRAVVFSFVAAVTGSAAAGTSAELRSRIFEQMQSVSRKYSLTGRSWDGSSATPAFRRNYSAEPHNEVFKAHIGGDKFGVKAGHNYSALYAETIAHYSTQGQPCRVLELGIFRGESLAVWTEFVSPNSVTGVDGNLAPYAASLTKLLSRGVFREGVPAVLQGLATDPAVATKVANGSLDLLIDDAGHIDNEQLAVFKVWSCKVAPRGSYVIEDMPAGPGPRRSSSERFVLRHPQRPSVRRET